MSGRGSANLRTAYDADRDVMYISIGAPKAAYGQPQDDLPNIIIRYDLTTDEVVGATIVMFSKLDRSEIIRRLRSRSPRTSWLNNSSSQRDAPPPSGRGRFLALTAGPGSEIFKTIRHNRRPGRS